MLGDLLGAENGQQLMEARNDPDEARRNAVQPVLRQLFSGMSDPAFAAGAVARKIIADEDTQFCPGSACRFCEAKGICPARGNQALAVLPEETTMLNADEQLVLACYRKLPEAKRLGVRRHLLDLNVEAERVRFLPVTIAMGRELDRLVLAERAAFALRAFMRRT